jgi:2'-5' RNA ligase
LEAEIKRSALQAPASAPFEPHVTLYHPIDLNTAINTIISHIETCCETITGELRLDINSAQTGTSYYQSILAAVQQHDGLDVLRRRCEQIFGSLEKPYFPHLSLKYGEMDDAVRTRLATQSDMPCSIVIRGVTLMRLEGTVEAWKEVAFIPFKHT